MVRSFELWYQTVDLGPHRFFSADARVNRIWLDVVGTDYRMVERVHAMAGQVHLDSPIRKRVPLKARGIGLELWCDPTHAHAAFRILPEEYP